MIPNQVFKNQFGETTNAYLTGGSNQIDINFVIDPANGNGLGNRNLKGSPLVANVYTHTSATPAAGNPNPPVGFVLVEFAKAFSGYITGVMGIASPVSGTPVNISSGLTLHGVYVITSVGTSTPANWQALGLPTNIVPAVGVSFVATTASAGTGTGIVETSGVSGIVVAEVVGDPNQTIGPSTGAGYILVQLLAPTNSSTTTLIPAAPAVGSVVGLRIVADSQIGAPIN